VPTGKLTRPSKTAVERDRDTGAEARFWQAHEAAHLGGAERPEHHRSVPSEEIHLRLGKSAIRRLKLLAAKAGLPFAAYASSVLVREAQGG
jgi:predicted DNA binding CopG/RHH family protein